MTFPIIIAYNKTDYKIGCALVQSLLGGTISGGDVAFHFDTDDWELDISKCKLYTLHNQGEFDGVKLLTSSARKS